MSEYLLPEVRLVKTGDQSLDRWARCLFEKSPTREARFYHLLKTANQDKYYLTNSSPSVISGGQWMEFGLMEPDLDDIFSNLDNGGAIVEKTRLALMLSEGIEDFPIVAKIGQEALNKIIIAAVVEGEYECFGLKQEDLIVRLIKSGVLERDDAFIASIQRGLVIQKRYPTQIELKKLKKKISFNRALMNSMSKVVF